MLGIWGGDGEGVRSPVGREEDARRTELGEEEEEEGLREKKEVI